MLLFNKSLFGSHVIEILQVHLPCCILKTLSCSRCPSSWPLQSFCLFCDVPSTSSVGLCCRCTSGNWMPHSQFCSLYFDQLCLSKRSPNGFLRQDSSEHKHISCRYHLLHKVHIDLRLVITNDSSAEYCFSTPCHSLSYTKFISPGIIGSVHEQGCTLAVWIAGIVSLLEIFELSGIWGQMTLKRPSYQPVM